MLVGNDYKILVWKYAVEKGFIYVLFDSVNVVNGLNRIVVDIIIFEFVNVILNFFYENNFLIDYELLVVNSIYSNVFIIDDVKVNF